MRVNTRYINFTRGTSRVNTRYVNTRYVNSTRGTSRVNIRYINYTRGISRVNTRYVHKLHQRYIFIIMSFSERADTTPD